MWTKWELCGCGALGLSQYGARPTWGWTDMGRADTGMMPATQSRKFENKSNKTRIFAIPILKLRPEMNSLDAVAFFTYTVKISDLKVVFFMVYIYNIQGQCDGTRCWQMMLIKFPWPTPFHPIPSPSIMPMMSCDIMWHHWHDPALPLLHFWTLIFHFM